MKALTLRNLNIALATFAMFVMSPAFANNSTATLWTASTAPTGKGATTVPIVATQIAHAGGGAPHNTNVTSMSFTPVNTLNSDVTSASLYYTATGVFATTTLLATDANIADGISFTGFSQGVAG